MAHITPDVIEADIILPMIYFAQIFNYNLEQHCRNAGRQTEDQQQWTTKEVTNDEVNKLARQAWKEKFNRIQPEPAAPHYRHSMALQTILSDESISGNLVRKIQEAITTFRGK